jgi:hypothetical protein
MDFKRVKISEAFAKALRKLKIDLLMALNAAELQHRLRRPWLT